MIDTENFMLQNGFSIDFYKYCQQNNQERFIFFAVFVWIKKKRGEEANGKKRNAWRWEHVGTTRRRRRRSRKKYKEIEITRKWIIALCVSKTVRMKSYPSLFSLKFPICRRKREGRLGWLLKNALGNEKRLEYIS